MMDIKMRTLIALTTTVMLFLLTSFSVVAAGQEEKPVTPFGDFCPRFTNYGMHRDMLSIEESEKALKDYYSKKGLDVEIRNMHGRFMKAEIKDNNKVVDMIIFDRRSGRIRSTY
jgi:hypothetical protein